MPPLIRILFALFPICFAVQTGFAGQGSVRPVMRVSIVSASFEKLDSILSNQVSVMEIKEDRDVALLAEKKNDGSRTAYAIAKNRIQKEKKHLKQMFYDKIKVVSEIQETGSCKELFYRLKTANVRLQLYEILNADIN
jgi:hypothetical protein